MLARWSPFQDLFELQRDLMNLFSRTFGGGPGTTVFAPSMDAYYKDGNLVVRVELAGVDPKSVDVSVAGRTLTVKGHRQMPEIPADDRVFSEILYGTFERSITLPEGLEGDQIKARWHHGILEVTIPVVKGLLPRKVPIEISA